MFDNATTTTEDKQYIATTVSHENAHMWFGNEVSPEWWDCLWLNEGFASYFEYHITDLVFYYTLLMIKSIFRYYINLLLDDGWKMENG